MEVQKLNSTLKYKGRPGFDYLHDINVNNKKKIKSIKLLPIDNWYNQPRISSFEKDVPEARKIKSIEEIERERFRDKGLKVDIGIDDFYEKIKDIYLKLPKYDSKGNPVINPITGKKELESMNIPQVIKGSPNNIGDALNEVNSKIVKLERDGDDIDETLLNILKLLHYSSTMNNIPMNYMNTIHESNNLYRRYFDVDSNEIISSENFDEDMHSNLLVFLSNFRNEKTMFKLYQMLIVALNLARDKGVVFTIELDKIKRFDNFNNRFQQLILKNLEGTINELNRMPSKNSLPIEYSSTSELLKDEGEDLEFKDSELGDEEEKEEEEKKETTITGEVEEKQIPDVVETEEIKQIEEDIITVDEATEILSKINLDYNENVVLFKNYIELNKDWYDLLENKKTRSLERIVKLGSNKNNEYHKSFMKFKHRRGEKKEKEGYISPDSFATMFRKGNIIIKIYFTGNKKKYLNGIEMVAEGRR